jgi:hypothetical protein
MMLRFLAAVAALAAAVPCAAQVELSSDQSGPASSAQEARVRGDLQALLLPGAEIGDGWSNDGRVRRASFYTRPVGTSAPGMCQRDMVVVDYASTNRVDPDKTPQASGVVAVRQYRFIRDPYDRGEWPTNPFAGECPKLGRAGEPGWYAADDYGTAVDGYKALHAAMAQLRAGKVKGCADAPPREFSCRAWLLGESIDHVRNITRCEAKRGHFCYAVAFPNDMLVTIRVHYRGVGALVVESVTSQFTGEICI